MNNSKDFVAKDETRTCLVGNESLVGTENKPGTAQDGARSSFKKPSCLKMKSYFVNLYQFYSARNYPILTRLKRHFFPTGENKKLIVFSNIFSLEKSFIVPEMELENRKTLFKAENISESEGIHFKKTIFSKKSCSQCRKYLRIFPQLLRKLSSVPQDQKIINEVSLSTLKRFFLQKISKISLHRKAKTGTCVVLERFSIKEGTLWSSLYFYKHKLFFSLVRDSNPRTPASQTPSPCLEI